MKRLILKLSILALALGAVATTSYADPAKGQRIYLKKLKKACGMNGAKMAGMKTQEEWLEIKDNGKFKEEIKTICPKSKELKENQYENLFDFLYEYAKDSGNVPSC